MRWLVASMTVLSIAASPLQAQGPISFSIAGGLSAPNGELGSVASLGWHGLASINVSSLMLPLGLRLDASYNSFSATDGILTPVDLRVISATGNLTYRLPMTNSPFSPYLIGGMGAYRTDCDDCESDTAFGWNAGVGSKLYLLGLRAFVEARYHSSSRGAVNVKYFPVSFGITF